MTILPPKTQKVGLRQVLLPYIYFFYKMTVLHLKSQKVGQTKKSTSPLYLFFFP